MYMYIYTSMYIYRSILYHICIYILYTILYIYICYTYIYIPTSSVYTSIYILGYILLRSILVYIRILRPILYF